MSFKFARGEVYLIQEDQPYGSEIKKARPWVLVGTMPVNAARHTVVAIPLSSAAKPIPDLSIHVNHKGIKACAVIDQIRALDKKRFVRHEGNLKPVEMEAIEAGLKYLLCL